MTCERCGSDCHCAACGDHSDLAVCVGHLRAEVARLSALVICDVDGQVVTQAKFHALTCENERLTAELRSAMDSTGMEADSKPLPLHGAIISLRAEIDRLTKELAASQASRDAIEGHWKDIAAEIGKAGPMTWTVTESAKRVVDRCVSAEAVQRGLRAWLEIRASDHTYEDGSVFVALTIEKLDELEREAPTPLCRWKQDGDGIWHSDCGRAFAFDTDGPKANGFTVCPYCGAALRE